MAENELYVVYEHSALSESPTLADRFFELSRSGAIQGANPVQRTRRDRKAYRAPRNFSNVLQRLLKAAWSGRLPPRRVPQRTGPRFRSAYLRSF